MANTCVKVVGMNTFYFASTGEGAWGTSIVFCSLEYIVLLF